ncbi:hemolysin III family protein [Thioalkalivibrio sp. XN8]|uniref:PAQR family membrane homeostasis protein TrhA n=1 Tax=Thioalkalivibrio sp. XN8 TaxID=2712863 RepID=UPI0013EC03D4|nr:hemolysin III family protein [Thioalkalivibrio sp. XN8]NGP54314.1 hemolysin III family protein [Thioalkalivibrio sp. XN8]
MQHELSPVHLSGHKRPQSVGEEIANSVSHGAGFLGAAIATPFLLAEAAGHGVANLVGAAVFAVTVMLAYLASTLYHAVAAPRAKKILRVIDHGSIFLLIAGTYTPFTLGVLRGGWGWTLFGLIWSLALAGLVMKAMGGVRFRRLSVVIYLAMGWLVLVAIGPLVERMAPAGLAWLVAGGVSYTLGVVFYALDGRRFLHFVWHLFVLGGTACHFVAVMRYAAGA